LCFYLWQKIDAINSVEFIEVHRALQADHLLKNYPNMFCGNNVRIKFDSLFYIFEYLLL